MVGFHTLISLLKQLYVSFRGNQPTLNNLKYIHTVVNALGSVVDMYSEPSLKSLCRVSDLEEFRTCLLTLSNLVIYSISSHFW